MLPTQAPPKKPRKGSRWDQTIYHPSIYTYTCRGAFFASSEDQGSEGTCRGLRTRLELLSDMDANTREGAIKNFTYMTDYELEEDDAANSLNQKTKSILISPALIYKEKGEIPTESQQQPLQPSSSRLPEEELIKRQRWSCYGSTEVELLVLKNEKSGKEHIAAVAPRNVGVSIRKIDADEGSITSIGVGWLNIVVDAGPAFVEEDEDEDKHQQSKHQQEQQSKQPSEPHHHQPNHHSSPISPEEVPPRPSPGSIIKARMHLARLYEFSGKVGEHMKINLVWLKENLEDDFPSRTLNFGQKMISNIPRTVDRTSSFMKKMIDRWQGGGDDRGGAPEF